MTVTDQDTQRDLRTSRAPHSGNNDEHDERDARDRNGARGRMLRWFLVVFLIFALLGAYGLVQRRTEHRVLAQQTDRMAVPYVSVIHALSVSGDLRSCFPATSILTSILRSMPAPMVTSRLGTRTSAP